MIDAAEQSRRPEYARAILVAATTGLRRAELCGLRRWRDLDLERGLMRVSTSVVLLPGRPLGEIPTKNRRVRMLAVDDLTASVLRAQIQMVEERARAAGVELVADPYVFTDAADGSEPWKPDAVSRYFARLRARIGLEHLDFHYLRKFMETYGQEMGYSVAQVAMRRPRSDGRGEALQRPGRRDRSSLGQGRRVASDADGELISIAPASMPSSPRLTARRPPVLLPYPAQPARSGAGTVTVLCHSTRACAFDVLDWAGLRGGLSGASLSPRGGLSSSARPTPSHHARSSGE